MSAKTSALAELTTTAADDLVMVVDVSDTSMGAGGTNKQIERQNFAVSNLSTDSIPIKAARCLTVTAYGALSPPDANTLYLVVPD